MFVKSGRQWLKKNTGQFYEEAYKCKESSSPGLTVAVKTCIAGQTVPLTFNKMLEVIFLVPET